MRTAYLLIILFLFLLLPQQVVAQGEASRALFKQAAAGCDLCGWCNSEKENKPDYWERCMACVFPKKATEVGITDASGKIINYSYLGEKPLPTSDNPFYPTQPEIDDPVDPNDEPISSKSWTVFGCMDTSPGGYVGQMYRILLALGAGLAFLALMYGGILIITAGSNPLQVGRGKSIMMGAIFGILLIFFSVFLLRLIGLEILKIPGFG